MKILLAYISGSTNRDDIYINILPTGLLCLHSFLNESGHSAMLANFSGWSYGKAAEYVKSSAPDIVGISQWTHNRHASLELARSIKKAAPGCVIILGGGHASFCYDSILEKEPAIDLIVRGEGELTLLELANSSNNRASWPYIKGIAYLDNGKILENPPRDPVHDLDMLPPPSKYLELSVGVDLELQAEFITTSRGCGSRCHFCASPSFWPDIPRYRSPEKVVDEILHIRERFGVIYFSFRDDTFTSDSRHTIELCRLLVERKACILWNCQSRATSVNAETVRWLKLAGCECIQLGVESGSPGLLKYLGKKINPEQVKRAAEIIKEAGINLSIYLISDIPGETDEDYMQTLELIKSIKPDDGYVSPLAWYPGTRLFRDAVASGMASADIFEKSAEAAVLASRKEKGYSARLLKALSKIAADKKRLIKETPYCYVSNVLAGEEARAYGNFKNAERLFTEITEREPYNPWGWYLLGELFNEAGKYGKSLICFKETLNIVPNHKPSASALLETKKKGA